MFVCDNDEIVSARYHLIQPQVLLGLPCYNFSSVRSNYFVTFGNFHVPSRDGQ